MAKQMRDDEEQLIARSQRGDVNAFNELILHYQQTTYGVVYRMIGSSRPFVLSNPSAVAPHFAPGSCVLPQIWPVITGVALSDMS